MTQAGRVEHVAIGEEGRYALLCGEPIDLRTFLFWYDEPCIPTMSDECAATITCPACAAEVARRMQVTA